MQDKIRPVSKVLILEKDPVCLERLKRFCEDHDLVGMRPQQEGVMSVLRSNVDLGGIFLAEDFSAPEAKGLALARTIHRIRPELPIFLRQIVHTELGDDDRRVVRAAYTSETVEELAPVIGESIFCLVYPNALVRGIQDISCNAFRSLFPGTEVQCETPYIVRDRIIYGEIFTLIPLESSWCRGYMMLQTEEDTMRAVLGLTAEQPAMDFRQINDTLSEATNLIWGGFKSRYVNYGDGGAHLTEIPIVINHRHRYISFGSQDPQLCLRYTLVDPSRPELALAQIYQRLIFNLSWSPDDFRENTSVESLSDAGELEIF